MKQTMLRAMIQAMLAEPCKAAVHHESKEVPVYDLVVAKGGTKFKQAETVDAAELKQKHAGGGTMRGAGWPCRARTEYGFTASRWRCWGRRFTLFIAS